MRSSKGAAGLAIELLDQHRHVFLGLADVRSRQHDPARAPGPSVKASLNRSFMNCVNPGKVLGDP